MTSTTRGGIGRRSFLAGTAAVTGALAAPGLLRAAAGPIRIGLIHPVTGALSYSGTQCRAGAQMAIDDINAAGGIKSLGGAKLEAVLGDSQWKPAIGASETDATRSRAGRTASWRAMPRRSALATTQEAAKTNTPHVVDVGVSDSIVERGLKNTFRFGPGYGKIAADAVAISGRDQQGGGLAGQDGGDRARGIAAFGTGTAKLLVGGAAQDRHRGGRRSSRTPTRRATSPTSCCRSRRRTPTSSSRPTTTTNTCCSPAPSASSRSRPRAIYSVLGGAASTYKFVKDFPEAAEADHGHATTGSTPSRRWRRRARRRPRPRGCSTPTRSILAYNAVAFLADAIERAGSTDKDEVIAALEQLDLGQARHALRADQDGRRPEPGRAAGQHPGARSSQIEVIRPEEFASAER